MTCGRMLYSGSPETVAKQIREFHDATGVGVIDIVFSSGQNPPEDIRRSIELFGREVIPMVRAAMPVEWGSEISGPGA